MAPLSCLKRGPFIYGIHKIRGFWSPLLLCAQCVASLAVVSIRSSIGENQPTFNFLIMPGSVCCYKLKQRFIPVKLHKPTIVSCVFTIRLVSTFSINQWDRAKWPSILTQRDGRMACFNVQWCTKCAVMNRNVAVMKGCLFSDKRRSFGNLAG